MIARRVRCGVLATACLGVACGDYSVPLPGNYRLVQANAWEVFVVDPSGEVAIAPHIVRYAVSGTLVTGVVEPSDNKLHGAVGGYFLVDTKTRRRKLGMSEEEWKRALAEEGVAPLELHGPTRYDRFR